MSASDLPSLLLITDGLWYRMNFIRFYHLRAYDRLNAPYGKWYPPRSICSTHITHPSETYLKDVEKRSNVSFHEAQVAQAREWIGDGMQDGTTRELKIFEVQGNVGGGLQMEGDAKKSDAKTKTLPLPQNRQEARRIVDRFENAARDALNGSRISDNVGQHAMKGTGPLLEERWFGNEDEERNWYVHLPLRLLQTELSVYQLRLGDVVHSLQADDCRRPKSNRRCPSKICDHCLLNLLQMGSANINDRSQKGDGDSEIALVVEDDEILQTTMNGRPYAASKFAATLRRRLYRGTAE